MCTSSRYWLIIYHNRLPSYIIVQIVGGPNKQESWFRRMHHFRTWARSELSFTISSFSSWEEAKVCVSTYMQLLIFRLSGKAGIQTMLLLMNYTILQLLFKLGWTSSIRPVASIKWLGGLTEWPTFTPPPPPPASVPRFKHTSCYMSGHYICLQYLLLLSLISVCVDFREMENLFGISLAENLPKNCFRVVLWLGLFLRLHQALCH